MIHNRRGKRPSLGVATTRRDKRDLKHAQLGYPNLKPLVSSLSAVLAAALMCLTPAPARAQQGIASTYPIPEPISAESASLIDANGVNVALGTYQISQTDVSIGPNGGGLSLVRGSFDIAGRFQHNHMAGITRLNWPYTPPSMIDDIPYRYRVSVEGYSETFTCPTLSTCTSEDGKGGTLNWDPDNNPATKIALYTAADGSYGTFEIWLQGTEPALIDWVDAATGVVTHYTYKTADYCISSTPGCPDGHVWVRRLQSVNNSLGYQLKFSYLENTFQQLCCMSPSGWYTNEHLWRTVTQVTGINNAAEYCNPSADTCSLSQSWPTATYSYVGDDLWGTPLTFAATVGAQDPSTSRTTTYYLPTHYPVQLYAFYAGAPDPVPPPSSITLPGSTSPDITIAADANGRVTSLTYHGDGATRTWTYGYSDSADPYISRTPGYYNLSYPSGPYSPPGPPAAGFTGTVTRTTTVTNPLSQASTYASAVEFRVQCSRREIQQYEWPYDRILAEWCETHFLGAWMQSAQDALGRTTSYQYDSLHRLTRATSPEGGYTRYTYGARGNITEMRRVSKTAGTPADLVTTASYPASCSNPVTCNKPTSIIDPRGFRTDFTYNSTHGGVLTATRPAIAGAAPTGIGTRPQTRYTYGAFNARYLNGASTYVNGPAVYRLIETSVCATGAWPACDGSDDETVSTIAYQSSGSPGNVLPVSVTTAAGDGSPSATVTSSYDNIGNVIAVDGPLSGAADTTRTYYNTHRDVIGAVSPDPDGGGALLYRAVRTTYDAKGLPTVVERGTTTSQAASYATAFAGFALLDKTDTIYNGFRLPRMQRRWSGGSILAVTQTSYDAAFRPLCSAVRMNAATFGSPPADACALGTAGAFGADRITRTVYDAAGQATKIQSAYGTALQQDTRTISYTPNGAEDWVEDARGNRTDYVYDGFDRLVRINFPSATVGAHAANTGDYELFTYDAAGNRISERRRDGQVFTLGYNNINQLVLRDAPGTQPDETRAYDRLGRQTCAQSWLVAPAPAATVCTSGSPLSTVSATFDALSRQLTETSAAGTVSYLYDAAGQRTRMTWPGGFYVTYTYNTAGEMTGVLQSGSASLAAYTYDNLGRRTRIDRGLGGASTFGYDTLSRLTGMVHNASGSAYDQSLTIAYSPASQIAARTRSNGVYDWNAPAVINASYTVNGLNQYLTVGGGAVTHDARGNLTNDGARTYSYDYDNRLVGLSGGVVLAWDPVNRLAQVTSGVSSTRFLYDGPALIAEMDGSGNVLRRYVHGASADEPVVWYEGAGTSDRRSLLPDERGSIIAVGATESAAVAAVNRYDEYGVPAAGNVGRFQYTGQMWLPEAGLYHYKARIYHPGLGRFLQTDPIRYDDGMNLYAYVGNDPVNGWDPSGLCTAANQANADTPASQICQNPDDLNLSTAGREHITGFEGYSTNAYQIRGDVPTIGIGHTQGVRMGDVMSEAEVMGAFDGDVAIAEDTTRNLLGGLEVSQQEFDALTDLSYNVGANVLNEINSPRLNIAIQRGDYEMIGNNLRYTIGPDGASMPGLEARSESRTNVFNNGDYSMGQQRYRNIMGR